MQSFVFLLCIISVCVTLENDHIVETVQTKNGSIEITYHTPEYYAGIYQKVYDLLQNGSGINADMVILFNPNVWGGFSNSFRGLYSTALLALVHGRRLRVNWYEYFDAMSSSLQFLQDVNQTYCLEFEDSNEIFKSNQVYNQCMLLSPYLDYVNDLMSHPSVRSRLVHLGLFETEPTTLQVRQLLTRSLFRLTTNLIQKSSSVIDDLGNRTSIGLQIRTGGKLANHPEDTAFFTEDTLDRIVDTVESIIQTISGEVVLFLSTDSNKVYHKLREAFSVPIVVTRYYVIGHSSYIRGGTQENLYRALIDLRVLAYCDYLVTTFTSSFGSTASYLSHSSNQWMLRYDYTV